MGWFFNRNNETPTQQFGASNSMGMTGMGGYGMQGGMQGGMGAAGGMMDPMMMQQMGQNPMMQQMANDPVIATSRLLQYYDPLNQFIVANQFSMMMDLVAEIVGKTAIEIVNTLIKEKYISSLQHAGDMGIELCKAEMALRYNLNYIQDKDLDIKLKK